MMYILDNLADKYRTTKLIRCFLMVCFLVIVTSLATLTVRKVRAQNEQIGKFNLPIMPNWRKDVYRSDMVERVIYYRKIEGTTVRLSFYYFPQGNSKQIFSPENKEQILESLKSYARLSSSEGKKTTLISMKEEESRFGLMLTTSQRTIYDKSIINQRNRYFYYDGKLYSIVSTLTGRVHSSKAILAEEVGWKKLWEKSNPR